VFQKKQYGWVGGKDLGSFTIETGTWRSLFQTSVESKRRSHTGWSCDEFSSTYGVL